MASKAQIRAVDRYNKAKTTTLCIRLNNETDKDISLLLAGYVHITDAENNTVSVNYLQHKQIEGNNFAFVCYNDFN